MITLMHEGFVIGRCRHYGLNNALCRRLARSSGGRWSKEPFATGSSDAAAHEKPISVRLTKCELRLTR